MPSVWARVSQGNHGGRGVIALVVFALHLVIFLPLWQRLYQPLLMVAEVSPQNSSKFRTTIYVLIPIAPPVETAILESSVRGGTAEPTNRRTALTSVTAASTADHVKQYSTGSFGASPGQSSDANDAPIGSDSTSSIGRPASIEPTLSLTLSQQTLKSLSPSNSATSAFQLSRRQATVEMAVAEAAAETGPWTRERIDSDTALLKRGTNCIRLTRPAIAKMYRNDESLQNLPWNATPSKCRSTPPTDN